ncbi:uncharacterized protein [Cicer arietinum]|uniref:Protein ENHANCED DISEASE RESISTANCE 4-like n=1 Tax=Cicer arietinum TaxID=3827 RepID=A0A1S2Z7G9_CICAR|nr:protein ENHANCED DISEASE RESISTANCE 4-like [Cicer arietinum]
MEDSAKMRLVRCPKCQNVLSELSDYSVYQCGGCGAVLRGKVNNGNGVVAGKSGNSFRKDVAVLSDDSDVDVKSNGGFSREDRRDSEKPNKGKHERILNRFEDGSEKGVLENGFDVKDEGGKGIRREKQEPKFQVGGSSFPRRTSNWPNEERVDMEQFRRNPSVDIEGVRFSTLNYPDEGTSRFSYNYGERMNNYNDMDGASRVQHLEQDRAELLRKLDELSKQLNNSSEMVSNPKEKGHLDAKMVPPDPQSGIDTWFPNGPLGSNRTSRQFFGPNKNIAGPPAFNYHHDPYGYTSGHEMSMHNFHSSMHNPNYIPGYGDPFAPQMMRGSHLLSHQFPPQQPMHPYFPGHYADTSQDSYQQYTNNPIPHLPSCSCFHCYNNKRRGSMPAPPATFLNNRFPHTLNDNPMLYRHEIPGEVGQHVHNSRAAIPAASSREKQLHTRLHSDFNSEMSDFVKSRPQKVMSTSGSKQRCHPIAGGSPFITCYNCFELLQLPKKVLAKVKNRKQIMRCGACSSDIHISVVNKKLVTSSHAEMEETTTRINDASIEVVNSRVSHSHGHLNTPGVNFSSDDYSGYDFLSVDRGSPIVASDLSLNSRKLQEMQSFHSSSPSTSEDENNSEVMTAPGEAAKSIQPTKASQSPPPAGSPLQEYLDYSSNNNRAVNRFGKGNQSGRSEHENVKIEKNTSRQNSLKEVVLATEMDVHDYSNTGTTQDYGDASQEHGHPRPNKGGESFFANIFKKGSRSSSQNDKIDDREKCIVTVNGQPLSDRIVKKAEKIAGPIQPGNYWYDSRAGFWGTMGGPCLGVIPPFIEEFNYPIPDKCAGGNTGVFVNGRELHQKDLELLARRGFPNDGNGSYILEISGRLLDVDTGEELVGLGKLAPTVEKAKHGFGMKVPKSAAA